jgi:hypothetical protein
MAHSAEPALFMPEKAKRASTPKRFLHMDSFAFLEVGFIGRVVGVRVTFDFNVSPDGCATGMPKPNLDGLPLVIPRFTEPFKWQDLIEHGCKSLLCRGSRSCGMVAPKLSTECIGVRKQSIARKFEASD